MPVDPARVAPTSWFGIIVLQGVDAVTTDGCMRMPRHGDTGFSMDGRWFSALAGQRIARNRHEQNRTADQGIQGRGFP